MNYTVNVHNGIAFLKTQLIVGKNNISVTFTSPNYHLSVNNTSFEVLPSTLDLNITIKQDFNNALIIFNLSKNLNDSIIINNESFELVNGSFVMNLSNLDYGEYYVEACLNDSSYKAFNSSKFFVNVKRTFIEVNNLTTFYMSGDFLRVVLKDEFGRAVVNRSVELKVNGEIYCNVTNGDGEAFISVCLPDSVYSAVVTFYSDDLYLMSQNSLNITVLSSISLPNITDYFLNSVYEVSLLDKSGNYLNNTWVSFVIDNSSYHVLSDDFGKAEFIMPFMVGDFEIKVVNPDTSESLSQKIKIWSRIVENKDRIISYATTGIFQVRVLDDFGIYAENVPVTFTFNGVNHIRYTDNEGYAKFIINNIKTGTYGIIIEYKGSQAYNNIIIKLTLITKNIVVKKGKIIKFKAKLLNKKGMILKGKKIIFKFKGKVYKAKTNMKGISIIKIKNKYKPGKYRIITIYKKIKIKNRIRIKG